MAGIFALLLVAAVQTCAAQGSLGFSSNQIHTGGIGEGCCCNNLLDRYGENCHEAINVCGSDTHCRTDLVCTRDSEYSDFTCKEDAWDNDETYMDPWSNAAKAGIVGWFIMLLLWVGYPLSVFGCACASACFNRLH
jgi:hypothetical protein